MPTVPGPLGPVNLPDDKLADRAGVTTVRLPSKGYPYKDANGDQISDGNVRISSMTVADEKTFSSKSSDASEKAIILIQRCCDLGKLLPKDLLIADQFFLIVKIRAVSYGNRYGFQTKCDECGTQFRHEIDIERGMNYTELSDDWKEPFQVNLPVSKRTLTCRLLRVFDEVAVAAKVAKQHQKNIHNSSNPGYSLMLARYLIEIDGEAVSEANALQFVEKMTVADRVTLTDTIDELSPGYDPELEVTCPDCGFLNEVVIPWGSEFFRPKSAT